MVKAVIVWALCSVVSVLVICVFDRLESLVRVGTRVAIMSEWMDQRVLRTAENGPKCSMTRKISSTYGCGNNCVYK